MRVDFDHTPLSVHVPFHRSAAYERALFGAFGSGKTYALIDEVIAWCLEQPGIRGLVARFTVPELRDTTEPIFFERLPAELVQAGEIRRTGGHVESFTFPNGSVVKFRSLDDWQKHRSLNIGFLAIDEANEIDQETYLGMLSRVRQRDITAEARAMGYSHEITRRGIWMATNPAGHDWVWNRFVNPSAKTEDRAPDSAHFKSTSLDNPYLPVQYVQSLLAYPDPWVKRYVLCDFDDFAGQIYESWGWDSHVIDPLGTEWPRGAYHWMALDPGSRNNNAGLWVYVDQAKRRLVGIAEYLEDGMAVEKHAAEFRRIEAQHKMTTRWRVSDPGSINNRDRGSNMMLHTLYARLGFHFELGPRRHADRIPMLAQLVHSKRFVVTKDCPQTYEQIKNYRWEDLSPAARAKGIDAPERPLKRQDHLVDCAQYLASRWVKPIKLTLRKENPTFSDEVHVNIRKQLRQRGVRKSDHDLGSVLV